MGYVEDTLGHGETIEYVVSFHWLWTFTAYMFLIISLLFAATFHIYIPNIIPTGSIELLPGLFASLVIFSVGFIIFLRMMIKKWTTERVLTDNRFIQKTGWILRNTEDIRIDRMEEVNLNQSILGRIFDYGDLRISGMGAGSIQLNMIDSPIEFQKSLNDLKVTYSKKGP